MKMKTKLLVLIVATLVLILLPTSIAFAADGIPADAAPVASGSGFPLLGVVLFAAPALVALVFGAYQYFSRM
jgi:hypothetical protein